MSEKILGIDPGTTKSGYVVLDRLGVKLLETGVLDNESMLVKVREFASPPPAEPVSDRKIAIEWIQSMGMAVGAEVFTTCMWVGRFVEAAVPVESLLFPRGRVKLHHCGSSRAKDGNVSQALRDKYGGKGTKKEPGFFHGVSTHAWQAAAVALMLYEGGDKDAAFRF